MVGHPAGDTENCLVWEKKPTYSVVNLAVMWEQRRNTGEDLPFLTQDSLPMLVLSHSLLRFCSIGNTHALLLQESLPSHTTIHFPRQRGWPRWPLHGDFPLCDSPVYNHVSSFWMVLLTLFSVGLRWVSDTLTNLQNTHTHTPKHFVHTHGGHTHHSDGSLQRNSHPIPLCLLRKLDLFILQSRWGIQESWNLSMATSLEVCILIQNLTLKRYICRILVTVETLWFNICTSFYNPYFQIVFNLIMILYHYLFFKIMVFHGALELVLVSCCCY